MNIKDIALRVAEETDAAYPWNMNQDKWIVKFAEALVAELAKENKPVLVLFQHDETGRTTSVEPSLADDFERMNKRWYRAGNLYTNPPTAEQIEQETAEAIAAMLESQHTWLTKVAASALIRSGAWKEFKKS